MSTIPSKDTTKAQRELASRILARRRLVHFIQRMDQNYLAGWVHRDICRRLEKFSDAVEARTSPRLLILMPPRHGKSRIASQAFPAWHLGRFPNHEFIAVSYNVALSMGFSRKVQALLADPRYPFDVKLDDNNQSAESWGIAGYSGGFIAAGVGGGIVGKGAHVLTIDDPIKNDQEADSALVREGLWDWYGSTAYTRLAPGGGVLGIQCMTGDTQVLLPDGTQKRLDAVRAGDAVATYDDGRLSVSTVSKWKCNGRDRIYKITMSSGRMTRSNGRHPFMVQGDRGLEWVRARNLNTGHKIVALPDSGGSGRGRSAVLKGAGSPPSAGGSACRTTTGRSGLMDIARHHATRFPTVPRISSTGMASRLKNMIAWSLNRAASALFVGASPILHRTGAGDCVLITTTPREGYVGCSATTATLRQDTLPVSPLHSPWPNTFDFMLDRVVSVEPDGEEDVFDVTVARTENFIADGLVSHNTCWHDDDWAGRIQQVMQANMKEFDADVDMFEIVKYPAIAEHDEWIALANEEIVRVERAEGFGRDVIMDPVRLAVVRAAVQERARISEALVGPQTHALLRVKGEALHAQRYDIGKLMRIKRTLTTRHWSALYQQNPVPDDGSFFMRDQFRRVQLPEKNTCNLFAAFDFAITEKQANDFTVGVVGFQDSDDLLHIADVRILKSGDSFAIVEMILSLVRAWYKPGMRLGFENGQIFLAIESMLKKKMREAKLPVPYDVLQPVTDKKVRASPLQGRMQQGRMCFSSQGEWYDRTKMEMMRFPTGVHDDIVDALAWLARMVEKYEAPRVVVHGKQHKSWKESLPGVKKSGSHMTA